MSPERGRTFCASLRSRNACQDFTRATSHRNLQEKCRAPEWAQNPDTHFVRACAVETHIKISQEPLYAETYRKNAADQSEHPDQAPAFTPNYRKNPSVPQCGLTAWGKMSKNQRSGTTLWNMSFNTKSTLDMQLARAFLWIVLGNWTLRNENSSKERKLGETLPFWFCTAPRFVMMLVFLGSCPMVL